MLVLRYTQKLLKDMKVAPVEVEDISSFFSWHVNIMQLRKNIFYLYMMQAGYVYYWME